MRELLFLLVAVATLLSAISVTRNRLRAEREAALGAPSWSARDIVLGSAWLGLTLGGRFLTGWAEPVGWDTGKFLAVVAAGTMGVVLTLSASYPRSSRLLFALHLPLTGPIGVGAFVVALIAAGALVWLP